LKVCIELRNYRRLTAIEWIVAAGRQPSIFIKLSHGQLLQISVGGAFGESPDESTQVATTSALSFEQGALRSSKQLLPVACRAPNKRANHR
jgi:hypothetical protein